MNSHNLFDHFVHWFLIDSLSQKTIPFSSTFKSKSSNSFFFLSLSLFQRLLNKKQPQVRWGEFPNLKSTKIILIIFFFSIAFEAVKTRLTPQITKKETTERKCICFYKFLEPWRKLRYASALLKARITPLMKLTTTLIPIWN